MSDRRSVNRRGFVAGSAGLVVSACTPSQRTVEGQPVEKLEWTLPKTNRARRDFDQVRSGKVVFVAHCMLNQKARITTAADFPAMFGPVMIRS